MSCIHNRLYRPVHHSHSGVALPGQSSCRIKDPLAGWMKDRLAASIMLFAMSAVFTAHPVGATGAVEITTGPGGAQLVRSVTPLAGVPELPVPSDGTMLLAGRRSQDEYLWLDQNHQAAIAENVAIGGDGTYGVAGWWLNNERTSLYLVDDDNVPEWTCSMTQADFQISVDMDDTASRITSTARYVPLYVFESSSSVPLFSHSYTAPLVGYHCGVSDAGNTYAGAAGNPSGGAGEVRVYDGSGTLRFIRDLPNPPEGISVSADGQVVAANVRTVVKVWDAVTGDERDSVPIPGETQATAVLSGDGTYLVTGGFSRTVRLYEWNGNEYVQLWSYLVPGTTWIIALAIAADGQTIGAGTWTNPTGGKVVVFDRSSPTPLWIDDSYGDSVQRLAFTPDGGLLAAASWGRQAGTVGNIVSVYERGSAIPIHGISDDAFPGVGSCFSVDISEDGGYVIAGGKAVHAREFGNGGYVMTLELVDPADVSEDRQESSVPLATQLVATPNPFMGSACIDLGNPRPGSPRSLCILDAGGRLVRMLRAEGEAGGWIWDGRDEHGRSVSAGAYLVRPAQGGANQVTGAAGGALRLLRIQ